jgi:hypothetical protein
MRSLQASLAEPVEALCGHEDVAKQMVELTQMRRIAPSEECSVG